MIKCVTKNYQKSFNLATLKLIYILNILGTIHFELKH